MKNHIEEFFSDQEKGSGTELFRVDDSNSDIKSEVTEGELRLINVLKMNDDYLKRNGLRPLFSMYYKNFLRLKISLERKGRGEFVAVNRRDNSDETIAKFGALGNIMNAKR